jgi:hypothetical protein
LASTIARRSKVFPNGTVVAGQLVPGESSYQLSLADVQDRARDARFVLDELTRWDTGDPSSVADSTSNESGRSVFPSVARPRRRLSH